MERESELRLRTIGTRSSASPSLSTPTTTPASSSSPLAYPRSPSFPQHSHLHHHQPPPTTSPLTPPLSSASPLNSPATSPMLSPMTSASSSPSISPPPSAMTGFSFNDNSGIVHHPYATSASTSIPSSSSSFVSSSSSSSSSTDSLLPKSSSTNNLLSTGGSSSLSSSSSPMRFTPAVLAVIAFLFLVSVITRVWNVGQPAQVLFDEVHFVSMAQWYKARKYFFDIHPPLGKLVLAFIAWLTDFHTDVAYRDISTAYQHEGYYYMRLWQAMCGATLPVVAFLTLKALGMGLAACTLAGFLVTFELSLQTISRAVLLDSFLYLCIGLAFLFAVHMWQAANVFHENLRANGFRFWFFTFLTGTFMGAALAVKHTGLMVVGLIGVVHVIKTFRPVVAWLLYILRTRDFRRRRTNLSFVNNMFSAGLLMIALTVIIHLACFVIHFKLLIYTGVDEDSMSDNYRSQLIGSNIQMPAGETPQGMAANIYMINKKMLEVNSATSYEHYYCSPWYEWLVMYRGIMYDWIHLPEGKHSCVYLFGNPLVYWIGLLSVIVGLFYCDRLMHLYFTPYGLSSAQQTMYYALSLCLFGYFDNLVPYMFLVKRPTYVYHYHPSLYFAILTAGVLFDRITSRMKARNKLLLVSLVLSVIFGVYYFYLPFSYAWPLTEAEHESRRWFKAYFPTW